MKMTETQIAWCRCPPMERASFGCPRTSLIAICVLGIYIFFASIAAAQSDTVDFDRHQFIYQLSRNWQVSSRSPSECCLDIIYKREPIIDSQGIEVIPNLWIKLIKILSKTSKRPVSDSVKAIDIFTMVCLLNYAPIEVFADYRHSKNLAPEYGLSDTNSYGFNSPYSDSTFKARHICLYFTMYDRERYGVFLLIDSTEEVFDKVKTEVTRFTKSIKII
jgi:hypothetical protein